MLTSGQATIGNTVEAGAPGTLEQICMQFDQQIARLHVAVSRTADNADRLVGTEPPSPEPATKEGKIGLATDRIINMLSHMDRLTDKLHQTNDRLNRL